MTDTNITTRDPGTNICLCAICRVMIMQSDLDKRKVADLMIYKLGELDSIELAHIACVSAGSAGSGWRWGD